MQIKKEKLLNNQLQGGEMESQLKTIAQDSANVIQSAIAWDEPLSGDDIEILVNTFKRTLQDLNGDDNEE